MALLRNFLPRFMVTRLWGDRQQWGLEIDEQDSCWKEWQNTYMDFYMANQRKGVGTLVNDAGYRVMAEVDLTGKTVLEIGPGDIQHINFWQTQPAEYILADVKLDMLRKSEDKLTQRKLPARSILLTRGEPLPLLDDSVDVVVSFYSLEHIYPLLPYLEELKRVLKPGGLLVGAIPAEGGLAWGGGRLITSRRWLKNNTTINPDKIICWEHPNFADEILEILGQTFGPGKAKYWPLPWLRHIDFNLVIQFIFKKQLK